MSIAEETTKLVLAIQKYGTFVQGKTDAINNSLGAVKGTKENMLFFGQDGQAMALKGDALLKKISLVKTDQQLSDAKGASVDFSAVFNQWHRFSHNSGAVQPANESELTSWAYDSATNQISCTINSATLVGIVSPESYSDYVFETDMSSSNADNDLVGIVLAYAEVNGVEHTLTLSRSPGGMGFALMSVAYNWAGSTQKNIGSKNGGLQWGDGVVNDARAIDNAGVYATGWSVRPSGCRVRATRVGDKITVISSNMGDNANYVATSQIVIDLASDPLLAKFMGSARYGYCAYSQAAATWKVLQAPATRYNILDTRNSHVWKWNGTAWVDSGYVSAATLDKNRLYKNLVDGSVYYYDTTGNFILLGAPGLGT